MNINDTLTIAPLSRADFTATGKLLVSASRSHLHLDWNQLDDLLTDPGLYCWIARNAHNNGFPLACLGVEHTPGGTGWLRLAAVARKAAPELLDTLWQNIVEGLVVSPVGVLAFDRWLQKHLRLWGFEKINSVVTLQRSGHRMASVARQSGVRIRDAQPDDMPAIAAIDALAFKPLWQHDERMLSMASRSARTFTVAELDGSIVGYQLSTQNGTNGHLARLAVTPGLQRSGIGSSLVQEMLSFFEQRDIRRVSVNTQQDNEASLKLYRKLGFRFDRHRVPVWAWST